MPHTVRAILTAASLALLTGCDTCERGTEQAIADATLDVEQCAPYGTTHNPGSGEHAECYAQVYSSVYYDEYEAACGEPPE